MATKEECSAYAVVDCLFVALQELNKQFTEGNTEYRSFIIRFLNEKFQEERDRLPNQGTIEELRLCLLGSILNSLHFWKGF